MKNNENDKKKRKKELSQKNWNSESKQRQMIIKQKIFAISTMSCKKILKTRNLKRRVS